MPEPVTCGADATIDGAPAPVRVLLIEDDAAVSGEVAPYLRDGGFEVVVADNGVDGLARALRGDVAAILLDGMLPGMDGMDLLRRLRAHDTSTPVMMLTARDSVGERVDGLDAGANDYLVKPFALAELLARVRALVRGAAYRSPGPILRVGSIDIDTARHVVRRHGTTVTLQPREFRFLLELAQQPGIAVPRAVLLERVWDYRFDPKTKILETHVSRLRAKLNACGGGDVIETARNIGYRLLADEDVARG
ncbi:hypothetical protein ASG29_03650 [Sphingomonas sp. Leaf412]|uniref:response regulator transcription factor n=1 Tax=Sphingomonas sp. Leaf412 TaxID=1736370 RepID=UPI0006FE0437|nr:response regulator transcription factor [Sphingomonas sp. Leaf412]KQT35216.1 hypothetical protein ASG29_03650 [Sphingomonas sp. Leaf412]